MSYLLSLNYNWLVEREAGGQVLYDSDDVQSEAHDEAKSELMEVANNTVDAAIPLGGLTTVEALLIISDQDVSFKINGGNTGVPCKSLMLWGCAITALSISNASGETANVRVLMTGT